MIAIVRDLFFCIAMKILSVQSVVFSFMEVRVVGAVVRNFSNHKPSILLFLSSSVFSSMMCAAFLILRLWMERNVSLFMSTV